MVRSLNQWLAGFTGLGVEEYDSPDHLAKTCREQNCANTFEEPFCTLFRDHRIDEESLEHDTESKSKVAEGCEHFSHVFDLISA